MAKRIKSVNGFTIYQEGPRSERTPDTYSIYYSADIREYGLANSDPNWEDIDTLEEALEYCAGNDGLAAELVAEHGDDDSWQVREAVELLLDDGFDADVIAELLDANVESLADAALAIKTGDLSVDDIVTLIDAGLEGGDLVEAAMLTVTHPTFSIDDIAEAIEEGDCTEDTLAEQVCAYHARRAVEDLDPPYDRIPELVLMATDSLLSGTSYVDTCSALEDRLQAGAERNYLPVAFTARQLNSHDPACLEAFYRIGLNRGVLPGLLLVVADYISAENPSEPVFTDPDAWSAELDMHNVGLAYTEIAFMDEDGNEHYLADEFPEGLEHFCAMQVSADLINCELIYTTPAGPATGFATDRYVSQVVMREALENMSFQGLYSDWLDMATGFTGYDFC